MIDVHLLTTDCGELVGFSMRGHAQVSVHDSHMAVQIAHRDALICRDILAGFKLHLLGLEEQYPENIRVNYLEV